MKACGVCRTDLHVVEGDLPPQRPSVVPGHEVIGLIDAVGDDVADLRVGERVGLAWLASACGLCRYCQQDAELDARPGATGC